MVEGQVHLCDHELVLQLIDLILELLLSEGCTNKSRSRRGGAQKGRPPFLHLPFLVAKLLCSIPCMVLPFSQAVKNDSKRLEELAMHQDTRRGEGRRREKRISTCFIKLICRWYSLDAACMGGYPVCLPPLALVTSCISRSLPVMIE